LRNFGGTLADIDYLADGSLDLAAVLALDTAGGGLGTTWHTAYDNAGIVNAVQETEINQMEFSTSIEGRGAMGGAAGGSKWLNLNLGTITQPTFFSAVVNVAALTGFRYVFGLSSTFLSGFIRLSGASPNQHWGVSLGGASIVTGKHSMGFLSNSATSKMFVDGVLNASGDSGASALNLTGGRIGSASSATTNWTFTAGNTISEFIVFNGDPTGLPGWADFVAAQKSYFGVV
jgi:hypothetical protein